MHGSPRNRRRRVSANPLTPNPSPAVGRWERINSSNSSFASYREHSNDHMESTLSGEIELWQPSDLLHFFTSLLGRENDHGEQNLGTSSGKNPVDDVPVHISQAYIATTEAISQFLVVESEKLEDRGMQIENLGDILHRMHA